MITSCASSSDPRTGSQTAEGQGGCAEVVAPMDQPFLGWGGSRAGLPAGSPFSALSKEGAAPGFSLGRRDRSRAGRVPSPVPPLCSCTLQPPSLLPSPLCSCLFLFFHLCSHHDFPSLSPPRTPSPCLISGYQGRLDFFNYGSVCLRCLQAWPSSRAGSDVPACSLSAWLHLFIPRSLAFFALLEI